MAQGVIVSEDNTLVTQQVIAKCNELAHVYLHTEMGKDATAKKWMGLQAKEVKSHKRKWSDFILSSP